MTTYATGNPLGSKAAKDLYDNAENLDFLMNGPEDDYPDRFGVARQSWRGMENDFQNLLANSGYEFIGDYDADGPLLISTRAQIFTKDGEYWRAKASLVLPYTTVNNWAIDQDFFVSIGDAALRVDLASTAPSLGAAIIGRNNQVVDSIAALKGLDKTAVSKHAFVTGYYAHGDGGGGAYYYDSTDVSSADNGGSIIVATDGGRWKLIDHGFYDVKQFGAKADWNGATGTDNSPLIQACINAAMLARKDVYLSPGDYKTLTTLVIDNSASTTYLDPKKINFYGAGVHMSRLIFLGLVGACLSILGGQGAGTLPMQCFQRIRDFDMLGTVAAGTYGLYLDTVQEILIENVAANSFDFGLNILDVDFAGFHKCIFHWNNHGAFGQERFPRLVNSTRPNAITFTDCRIAGNSVYGVHFLGGACINFYGGHIEGNGQGSGGSGWGARFEGSGVQGGVGANINGVYFEANQGVADVWMVALDPPGAGLNPYHCVQIVQSCSFNRVTNSFFTDHNIVASFDTADAGKQKLVVRDSSFKGYGTYAPSALRQYIHFAADVRSAGNALIEGCIMQDDVESVPQNDNYNVSLGLSAVQSVNSGVATDIFWTAELYDGDAMHVTNSNVVTVPVTGKYMVNGSVYWAASATGVRTAQLMKNGATEVAGTGCNATSSGRTRQNFSRELLLNKGDTLSLRAFQDSGVALNADTDGTFITIRAIPY